VYLYNNSNENVASTYAFWSLFSELLPAFWLLKKMFKVSALIRLAGTIWTRLLALYFYSTTSDWGSLPRFTVEGPSRAVARCCSADYYLFMFHVTWWSTTVSSCSPRVLEQRVYWTLDRTRWTNSMACSFL